MPRFIVPALLMFVALSASGAELGEVSVRSHIGQQLSADIELVDLSAADLADLQVRLASADVFAGARVSMNPALAGLNMSVYKNGARRMLHLTTLQPVNAELVHIFFELGSGGRQIVRTASLWLTPEPPGAARAVAAASVPAAPAAAAVAVPVAPAVTRSASPATAPAPDIIAAPSSAVTGPVAAPSATRAAPARTPAARPLPVRSTHDSPDEEMMKAAAEHAFAARAPKPVAQPARLAIAPAPPRLVEACSPALVEARAQQCAAMDASNKELTTKLVDLEGKVKRLQTALVAAPAASSAAGPTPASKVPAAAPSAPKMAGAAAPSAPKMAGAAAPSPLKVSTVDAPPTASKAAAADATPATPAAGGPVASTAASAAASTAHSASGSIKDARAAAAEASKSASAPTKPPAAEKAPEEEKTKKMSRPRLITLIAGGAVGLLALIGVTVHLLRRRRAKGGPLKIWQSFRKKDKPDSPVEPSMDEATESASVAAVQE
jgi:pilus assembly protein FimV